jgi:hypothetical protein
MGDCVITVIHEKRVLVPSMPNFIRVEGEGQPIPVGDLSKESIEDIADAWRRAFRDHCAGRDTNGRVGI